MEKNQPQNNSLPQRVMYDILWGFTGTPCENCTVFNNQVRQYQIDIRKQDTWKGEQVVISSPRIEVGYIYWEEDEQIEAFVELKSDNGEYFTASELLFKLHNAVVEQLRDIDCHFFEGLTLAKQTPVSKVPLYYLQQGS